MREWQRKVTLVVGKLPKRLGWLREMLDEDPGKRNLASQMLRSPRPLEEHDQRKKPGRLKVRQ